jgi:hypothetical protein
VLADIDAHENASLYENDYAFRAGFSIWDSQKKYESASQ